MQHAPGFLKLVDDAKSRVKETDFRDVKKKLDANEKFTLIDVREDSEWTHREDRPRQGCADRALLRRRLPLCPYR